MLVKKPNQPTKPKPQQNKDNKAYWDLGAYTGNQTPQVPGIPLARALAEASSAGSGETHALLLAYFVAAPWCLHRNQTDQRDTLNLAHYSILLKH